MRVLDHPEVERWRRLIQRRRTDMGRSRRWLANKAGVSIESVNNVERATRMPTLGTLLRITDALGIRVVAELGPEPAKPSEAMKKSLRYVAEYGPIA